MTGRIPEYFQLLGSTCGAMRCLEEFRSVRTTGMVMDGSLPGTRQVSL